jgi:hypothetical protein
VRVAYRYGDIRDSKTSDSAENPAEYIEKIADAMVLYTNHSLGGPGDEATTRKRRAHSRSRVS